MHTYTSRYEEQTCWESDALEQYFFMQQSLICSVMGDPQGHKSSKLSIW